MFVPEDAGATSAHAGLACIDCHADLAGTRRPSFERLFHVLAGAEAATGTGQDGDLQVIAVAELGEGVGHGMQLHGIQFVGGLCAQHQDSSVGVWA